MLVSLMFRRAAVALLAAAFGSAALTGCGGPKPTAPGKADAPGAPKSEPKPGDKAGDKSVAAPAEIKTALGPVEKGAEQAVETFLRDLGQGTASADALSAALLSAAGKPWELPEDTAKKVSPEAAARWLRTVGRGRSFSLSLDRKQAGDAIYWRGTLQGQPGAYSVRLLREGGAWKVDWLALSSVEHKGPISGATADDAFQEFAVRSFVETLADASAMEQRARAAALARAMVPALRAAWGPPFDSEKVQGYDYNPGKLTIKATEYGGGTSTFDVTKAGDLTYTVELTKPAGKKVLTIRLAKGATAGEWLVAEVAEKG